MHITFAGRMPNSIGKSRCVPARSMKIRTFVEADLARIYAIQQTCPEAAQWRQDDYVMLARDPLGLVLVAEEEDGDPSLLAGFAAFKHVLDEAELLNLAVDPHFRRKGIARALLAAAIRELLAQGVSRVFLEVRASNDPARHFYTTTGFKLQRRRRDYYHDPVEDAIVMECTINTPSQPDSPDA
jgi:[ribosomal protein S18]-alanine N-acetyltransferase